MEASSALVAIRFAESGYLELVDRALLAERPRIGAPTLVETSLVHAGRRRRTGSADVEALVRELAVTVVPFGEVEWCLAVEAFERFGRGRRRAALSFGDYLAYATARSLGAPLLFVGDNFMHTDIAAA